MLLKVVQTACIPLLALLHKVLKTMKAQKTILVVVVQIATSDTQIESGWRFRAPLKQGADADLFASSPMAAAGLCRGKVLYMQLFANFNRNPLEKHQFLLLFQCSLQ